jgi:cytochrome c
VDGDLGSRWASRGPFEPVEVGDPNPGPIQWLQLDLGGVRFIDSIDIHWENAYSRDYDIQVSHNGQDWTTLRTLAHGNGGNVEVRLLDVLARHVRIFSRNGDENYGISIYEVKIYGDSSCDTTCRQSIIEIDDVEASSSESYVWDAQYAIDGDYSDTRWSSAFEDGEWIAVDLGELTFVYAVGLFWERAYATSYELQTSDVGLSPNDNDWTTIRFVDDSDGALDILGDLNLVTQYLRLVAISRSTGYGSSLWEFAVRGTKDTICAN